MIFVCFCAEYLAANTLPPKKANTFGQHPQPLLSRGIWFSLAAAAMQCALIGARCGGNVSGTLQRAVKLKGF